MAQVDADGDILMGEGAAGTATSAPGGNPGAARPGISPNAALPGGSRPGSANLVLGAAGANGVVVNPNVSVLGQGGAPHAPAPGAAHAMPGAPLGASVRGSAADAAAVASAQQQRGAVQVPLHVVQQQRMRLAQQQQQMMMMRAAAAAQRGNAPASGHHGNRGHAGVQSSKQDFKPTWHKSKDDLPLRRRMIQLIMELLQKRKPDAPQEWRQKIPEMARRLEDSLYRSAKSREYYNDNQTLKQRLQYVATQYQKQRNRVSDMSANRTNRNGNGVVSQDSTFNRLSGSQEGGVSGVTAHHRGRGPNGRHLTKAQMAKMVKQKEDVLRQQQQRLLLLRHASKCKFGTDANPAICTATKHCAQMKKLWAHITKCKNTSCQTPHCVSSRYVLSHYNRCKEQKCAVCKPVRDAILKHKNDVKVAEMRRNETLMKMNPEQRKAYLKRMRANQLAQQRKAASNIRIVFNNRKKAKRPKLTAKQKAAQEEQRRLQANIVMTPKPPSSLLMTLTAREIIDHCKSLQSEFSSVYSLQQIKSRLKPVIEKLRAAEGGYIFEERVNPSNSTAGGMGGLSLPDYYKVLGGGDERRGERRLMCLNNIEKQLNDGKIKTLDRFLELVRRMFHNAMMYNPYGEEVWKYANNLLKLAETEFQALAKARNDEALKKNKDDICRVCHGDAKFKFEGQEYTCNGTKCKNSIGGYGGSRIKRNATYWTDDGQSFHWCKVCYADLDHVFTSPKGDMLEKKKLQKKKNDKDETEPWVQCDKCMAWVHQVCGMFNDKQHKKNGGSGANSDTAVAPTSPRKEKGKKGKKSAKKKGGKKGKVVAPEPEQDPAKKKMIDPYYCPHCLLDAERRFGRPLRTKRIAAAKLPKTTMSYYIERMVNHKIMLAILEAKENFRYMDNGTTPADPEAVFCTDKTCRAEQEKYAAMQMEQARHSSGGRHVPAGSSSGGTYGAYAARGVKICKHEVPKITVRVVQSKKDTNDVETQMTRRYKSMGFPSEFHYQNKCVLLFQEIGGIDVLIFGMYVQEYDHNVTGPNNRAVYISYLDTVKYFRPARLRTMMYCEVLISYFSFARERGFAYGFIWACPPEKGDDYILHCKPEAQKTPNKQKLQKWYQDLLDSAERRGLVYSTDSLWDTYFAKKVDPLDKLLLQDRIDAGEQENDAGGGGGGDAAGGAKKAGGGAAGATGRRKAAAKGKGRKAAKGKSKAKGKTKGGGGGGDGEGSSGASSSSGAGKKRGKNSKVAQQLREHVLTTQLPHFDGDYWPGMIKSIINDVSSEERSVVEKEEAAEKAKKATMIEVTKRKRKRRKKVPFQAGGEQPQGSGSKPPPLLQEEPEDSPYGLYDPNKSLQDLIVPRLAERAIEMRKDFLVVHLTPRCWHCDKYIMEPVRYRCERTRKERMPNRPTEMVDKRYVLCQVCYDSIPDESKQLTGEVHLKNSCSEFITEENRKLTMVKSLSKPWPPEETKTKEDGVLPDDESVGDGGKKRSRSGTPALPTSDDVGAAKEGEGKESDGALASPGAEAAAGTAKVKEEKDETTSSSAKDAAVEVKKENGNGTDADGDVDMTESTADDAGGRKTGRRKKKEVEVKKEKGADDGDKASSKDKVAEAADSAEKKDNEEEDAEAKKKREEEEAAAAAKQKEEDEKQAKLVAMNRAKASPELPLKVTWPGRRAFQREIAARFSPEVVEKDPEMECEVFQTRPEFLSMCQRNHYQFDQLRRAKHSSMMILYHLHNPHEAMLTHNCANCRVEIDGTRYECKGGCDDFHLCKPCYTKIGKDHVHELKEILPASSDSAEKARARKRSIQLHMTLLVHASKCKDRNCRSSNCAKMKALLRHGAHCETRATGGCPTCRRIWALLQIHARQCRVSNGRCSVPRCADLKKHLRDLRMQQRRRDDRRRQQFDTGHAQHQAQLAQASASSTSATATASSAR